MTLDKVNVRAMLKIFILGLLKSYPVKTPVIPDILEVFKNVKNKDSQNVPLEVFQKILKTKGTSDLSEESILRILETGRKLLKKYSEEGWNLLIFDEFPEILRNRIRHDLPFLFVKGNSSLLNGGSNLRIGIVGTREPSKTAIENVKKVIEIIEPYEAVVVSGLAEGIDTHAHVKSLQRNLKNIGFLGYGIEKIPSRTKTLISQITAGGGAVVSVFSPFQNPCKFTFLERNYYIALFSDIVFVIEGKVKSGTASVALKALNLKKPVFVLKKTEKRELVEFLKNRGAHVIDVEDPGDLRKIRTLILSLMSKYRFLQNSVRQERFIFNISNNVDGS